MSKNFSIRIIEVKDLIIISQIHRSSFESSALSQLGTEAVRRYYHWLLTGPHEVVALCAITQTEQIAGFIFSGIFKNALSGFINNNKIYLFKYVSLRPWLLTNPIIREQVKTALKIIRHNSKIFQKNKNALILDLIMTRWCPQDHLGCSQ